MKPPIDKLEIIFENEVFIAINKPHGLLVHPSKIARDATEFAMQILRDQVGYKVYPCHRLDRKTSGLLLFAKSKEMDAPMQRLFQERAISKTYIAIVRGFTDAMGTIDHALKNSNKTQEASTDYRTIQRFEINEAIHLFQTSRYSLVELKPKTGRFHQLRRHMAHIRHPILGDRPHGCNKHNKLWKEKYTMDSMMLHAQKLEFIDPLGAPISLTAKHSSEFERVWQILLAKNTL